MPQRVAVFCKSRGVAPSSACLACRVEEKKKKKKYTETDLHKTSLVIYDFFLCMQLFELEVK